MIKYRFYQKIENVKMCNFFFIRENVIFSPKIPVFSIPVLDIGPKVKNSDPPKKVTYTMLELS